MKRILLMILFLSVSLCGLMSVMAQDFSSLLEKAENIVQAKNPGWKLVRKQEVNKEVIYQWGSATDGVMLVVFHGASEQEAEEKLNDFMSHLSVGPTKKLIGIGDEAYLYKSYGSDFGAIRFRKANIFVDVNSTSGAIVEDMAKKIADLIPGK